MKKFEIGSYHVNARIGIKRQKKRRVLSLYCNLFSKGIHLEDLVISLGQDVDIEWVGRGKYGQPKGSGEEAEKIRNLIFKTEKEIESSLKAVNTDVEQIDANKIKGIIKGAISASICGKPPHGLRQEHKETIEKRTLKNVCAGYLNSKSIQEKNFWDAAKFFEEFYNEKYSKKEPLINEVTEERLQEFKSYLMEPRDFTHNSVVTYLGKLNSILLYAVKKKMITKNPMPKRFIGHFKPSGVQPLSVKEIEKIKAVDESLLKTYEQQAKQILLLQLATGLGYSELKSLHKNDVVETETGLSFDSDRKKTGKPFFIPLSPLAIKMYEKLASDKERPFSYLYTGEYFTSIVKELAKKVGIKKNLTSTTGRKTFATQWVLGGNNIYDLSKILGHTNVKQTMDYVRYDTLMAAQNADKAYRNMPFIIN